MFANALKVSMQESVAAIGETKMQPGALHKLNKSPFFSRKEFSQAKGIFVVEYFELKWCLDLSRIALDRHADSACVYTGSELNNALKFLVTPKLPEDLTYDHLTKTLTRPLRSCEK